MEVPGQNLNGTVDNAELEKNTPSVASAILNTRPKQKRSPRKSASLCPLCNTPMRAVHITKDKGGFRIVPGHFGCPNCNRVFKVSYTEIVR